MTKDEIGVIVTESWTSRNVQSTGRSRERERRSGQPHRDHRALRRYGSPGVRERHKVGHRVFQLPDSGQTPARRSRGSSRKKSPRHSWSVIGRRQVPCDSASRRTKCRSRPLRKWSSQSLRSPRIDYHGQVIAYALLLLLVVALRVVHHEPLRCPDGCVDHWRAERLMGIELRILTGARAGQTEWFDKDVIAIGRHPTSDFLLDVKKDLDVSRRHGEIRQVGAGYRLYDKDSTNGTFVNDEQVAPGGNRDLRSGDKVRFGAQGPTVAVVFAGATTDAIADESSADRSLAADPFDDDDDDARGLA